MVLWGLPPDQTKLLSGVLCVLRVPGILLLDLWWVERSGQSIPNSLEPQELGEVMINLTLLFLSFCLLLLPLVDLVHVYMHVLAAGCLYASHSITNQFHELEESKRTGSTVLQTTNSLYNYLYVLLSLAVLTLLCNWCLEVFKGFYSTLFPGLYIVPVLLRLAGLSVASLQWTVNTVDVFMIVYVFIYGLGALGRTFIYITQVNESYSLIRQELGNHHFIILIAQRALQPTVMVLYWSFLFSAQVWNNYMELEQKKYLITDEGWHIQVVLAMSEVCESPLILISFCTTIMYVSKGVMDVLQAIFSACGGGQVGGDNPLAHTGVAEGMVTIVLAFQTGLVDLEMPERAGATTIILFVVAGSMLQSAFEITSPVLLALPATNRKLRNHIPILTIIFIILLLPALLLHVIIPKVSSMWILVVISSYVVTIVQCLGSVLTYGLFMWDSVQPEPSQNMDEYVFYVKAVTKGSELILAVTIVSGGIYECLTNEDELSVMNLGILVVHCYFNIYQRIACGWRTYMSRRETKKRLSVLDEASREEIEDHGDVCSICYQDMLSAKKTGCGHFFHSNCLKRWLFVQDNCPMCTAPIIAAPPSKEDPIAGPQVEDPNATEEDFLVASLSPNPEDSATALNPFNVPLEVELDHEIGARGTAEVSKLDKPCIHELGSSKLDQQESSRSDQETSTLDKKESELARTSSIKLGSNNIPVNSEGNELDLGTDVSPNLSSEGLRRRVVSDLFDGD